MQKFYERYWNNKNSELEDFRYKWSAIKKLIPKQAGTKLLDFGCGKGKISTEILKLNSKIELTGSDISKIAVKTAKKQVPQGKFILTQEDKPLPFKDNSFDFILAADVIEHIYDIDLIFSELARILKPSGKILISVPYHGLIKNLIIVFIAFDFVFNVKGPHIRFFTNKALAKCLRDAGLKPSKFGYFGRFFPIWNGMYLLGIKS